MRKRRSPLLPALAGVATIGGIGTALGLTLAGLPLSRSAKTVRIEIQPGVGAPEIAKQLEDAGVIRSAWWFTRLASKETLKPGVYDLSPSESPAAIVRKLARGEFAGVKVTFPEGFTLRKMAARLVEKKVLAGEDEFLSLAQTRGKTFKASFPLPASLEGYLFPDTYRIPLGSDARAVIQRLLANFDRKVGPKLKAAKKPVGEAIIKASLIEREAEVEEDRAKIAGVIENRLAKGMRLQIDATVQYALPAHKSRLLFADLKYPSPYNTYLNKGLPPGAICCPGLPSIQAALNPEKSNYLFYVAGPDGKKHLFAATFAEHQKNIRSVRNP